MIFFFICLSAAFLLSLFILHVMTREDYALMRRNISMEQLYNIAFLTFLSGIFFARVFFIIFHFHLIYLNPVVFFALFYFPGLSLFGAIIGILLALGVICYKNNYPWKKFFDFFSISFACGLPLAALGTSALHPQAYLFPILASVVWYALIGVIGIGVFYRRILRNVMMDGLSTALLLISIVVSYCLSLFWRVRTLHFIQQPEVISLLLLCGCLITFLGILIMAKKKEKV